MLPNVQNTVKISKHVKQTVVIICYIWVKKIDWNLAYWNDDGWKEVKKNLSQP